MTSLQLPLLVHHQAARLGDKIAMRYRDYAINSWLPITWNQFSEIVCKLSCSFVEIGLVEFDNVGVFSQNMPECLYVDFALYANRAVSVPMYATSSESQIQYIINDAQIKLLFVGEQYQYDIAKAIYPHCTSLQRIVVFDHSVTLDVSDTNTIYFDDFLNLDSVLKHQHIVDERTNNACENDLATILYTSGTTGNPKGVMLHHSCFIDAFRAYSARLGEVTENDISLSFLPMAHVFEKAWSYFCIYRGVTNCINLHPADIQQSIKEIRPTLMCAVPRFWEKVYSGVQEKMRKTHGIKRILMVNALKVGKKYNVDCVRLKKRPSLFLTLQYKFYDRLVFSVLKKAIGLDRGHIFPTGGAAISDTVCEFIHSVGIPLITGYGLTESTATVSCTLLKKYTIGSVGELLDGVKIKFADNNEILLKGKIITKGYYKDDKETANAFTSDGWFKTGDAGYMKDNELYITERIKDLFKTSNGKYIAPQALESRLSVDRYIDQIAIIADQRKYVSALIVPVYSYLEEFATEQNIAYSHPSDLLRNQEIIAFIKMRIEMLQKDFASYEKVKIFTLLDSPFCMEKGELTNTLKLKRKVINEHYHSQIEEMYKE